MGSHSSVKNCVRGAAYEDKQKLKNDRNAISCDRGEALHINKASLPRRRPILNKQVTHRACRRRKPPIERDKPGGAEVEGSGEMGGPIPNHLTIAQDGEVRHAYPPRAVSAGPSAASRWGSHGAD